MVGKCRICGSEYSCYFYADRSPIRRFMLKELSSVQAYLPFIHAMLADPDFCDPMLATPAQLHQHLLDAHEDPAKHLFGTFDGGTLTGLFSVLVLPEEG